MFELSLNIMDIVQNSIRANTKRVKIFVEADSKADMLTIEIADDGDGMGEDTKAIATDPFYTTRTTRKVGLGLPYFEMISKMCGGEFALISELGKGTTVKATFRLTHIDRAPLGNMGQTLALLAGANPEIDFVYELICDGGRFLFDTVEIKELLGGVGINAPEVIVYLQNYINENSDNITGRVTI